MAEYTPAQQQQLLNDWNKNLELGLPATKHLASNMEDVADASGVQAKRVADLNREFNKFYFY